jgi:hypothetical protein
MTSSAATPAKISGKHPNFAFFPSWHTVCVHFDKKQSNYRSGLREKRTVARVLVIPAGKC